MFRNINQIKWDGLVFCDSYDIPSLFYDLLADSVEVRENAIKILAECLNHQGDICEGSYFAIPFLMELVTSSEFKEKAHVLSLIARILTGAVLPRKKGWVLSEKIYQEVYQHVDLFASFLNQTEKEVKLQTINILSGFVDHTESIIELLIKHFQHDLDIDVRINILYSAAEMIEFHPLQTVYEEKLSNLSKELILKEKDACLLVELIPTMINILKEKTPPQFTRLLIDSIISCQRHHVDPWENPRLFSILYDLRQLGLEKQIQVMMELLEAFTNPEYVAEVANYLLFETFEESENLVHEFTALQSQVLKKMVDTDNVWILPEEVQFYRFSLPETRDGLRNLVEN